MSVNGKEVSADIPDGKITLEKLEATVMSAIRQYVLDAQTAKGVAEQAASTAQGWAIGGESFEKNNAKYFSGQSKRYAVGGVEEGDEADNAQYYCEEARKAAEQAAGSAGFDGTAASVSAGDTHDLTGAGVGKKSTVQNLLDVIAQNLVEKVVTSDTFQQVLVKYLVNNGLTTETGKFALDAAYGKNLQDQITQQNSNMIKNKQDASVNPDVILTTDIRTLNGWDAELQKHIPQQLRNQWITCITSSPYDGSASEAVCQIMIGTSSGIIATRNGRNGGGWSNYFVK